MGKYSHGLKNRSKTQNQLKTKNLLELRYVFLGVLKVKKKKITPNLNFPHHTEPFATKINHFSGQNLYPLQLSFSKLESNDSLSLHKKKRLKEKGN